MQSVLDVVGALQQAASANDVQSAYLTAISTAVSAGGHGFYVLDPSNGRPVDVVATVPDSFLERYENEGRYDDPVLDQAIAARTPIDSSRLSSGRSWSASAVLAVLQQAGFYHSLEAPVLVDGEVTATLNMARQPEAPPFSRQDLTVMRHVAEQVGAALTRAQRYEQVTREALVLADALDASEQPIVITTVEGQLIFRNRMAARPMPGSSMSYFDRVQPVLGAALDQLRSGTKRIANVQEHVATHAGTQSEGNADPSMVRRSSPGDELMAVKAVRLRSGNNAVVSFVSQRHAQSIGLPDSATPLSPRERGIADLVSRGLTNRQIAELSYVSENTVKQHLKRIFTKLEVNSRAALVQAVWQASTSDDTS